MKKKALRLLALTFSMLALFGCGGSNDAPASNSSPGTLALTVDTDPNSCSYLSNSGDVVIVGSGLAGDPAAPEPSSGYRLGYKAKHSSQYTSLEAARRSSKAG